MMDLEETPTYCHECQRLIKGTRVFTTFGVDFCSELCASVVPPVCLAHANLYSGRHISLVAEHACRDCRYYEEQLEDRNSYDDRPGD